MNWEPLAHLDLDDDAAAALTSARWEAARAGRRFVSTNDLVLGFLNSGCQAGLVLHGLGITEETARVGVVSVLRTLDGPRRQGDSPTNRLERAIGIADVLARTEGVIGVDSCHLLVGLLREGGSTGALLLRNAGVTEERVHRPLQHRRV